MVDGISGLPLDQLERGELDDPGQTSPEQRPSSRSLKIQGLKEGVFASFDGLLPGEPGLGLYRLSLTIKLGLHKGWSIRLAACSRFHHGLLKLILTLPRRSLWRSPLRSPCTPDGSVLGSKRRQTSLGSSLTRIRMPESSSS